MAHWNRILTFEINFQSIVEYIFEVEVTQFSGMSIPQYHTTVFVFHIQNYLHFVKEVGTSNIKKIVALSSL